ncbi:MAG: chorismate mutase [Acidobacteriia bacterium]|nr:chorismate mutase [Terriglobia bacterium]
MGFDGWRKKIDAIDLKLVKLLNRRSQCAIEIGKLKLKTGLPVYTPEREVEVLRNVTTANQGPLNHKAIRRLFERIIDEARGLERDYMDRQRGMKGPKKKR